MLTQKELSDLRNAFEMSDLTPPTNEPSSGSVILGALVLVVLVVAGFAIIGALAYAVSLETASINLPDGVTVIRQLLAK